MLTFIAACSGEGVLPCLLLCWIFWSLAGSLLMLLSAYKLTREDAFMSKTPHWLWGAIGLSLLQWYEEGRGIVMIWDGKGLYLAWIFPCWRQLFLPVNFLSCHLHRFIENSVHFVLYFLYVTFSDAGFYSLLWDASKAYFCGRLYAIWDAMYLWMLMLSLFSLGEFWRPLS